MRSAEADIGRDDARTFVPMVAFMSAVNRDSTAGYGSSFPELKPPQPIREAPGDNYRVVGLFPPYRVGEVIKLDFSAATRGLEAGSLEKLGRPHVASARVKRLSPPPAPDALGRIAVLIIKNGVKEAEGSYRIGDLASFEAAVALRLVRTGLAEFLTEKAVGEQPEAEEDGGGHAIESGPEFPSLRFRPHLRTINLEVLRLVHVPDGLVSVTYMPGNRIGLPVNTAVSLIKEGEARYLVGSAERGAD